ncbi:hypothetical protein ACYSNX_01195 [Myroides sp. LJL115]
MRSLLFLPLLCLGLLLMACQPSSNQYTIDNPTDQAISVYIDQTAYDIPANSKLDVDIKFGKHTLKYLDQEVNFHNGGRVNNSTAIINPTQSSYVFLKTLFVDKNDSRATPEFIAQATRILSDSVQLSFNDTITKLFVPFKVSNQLFIQKTDFDWDFGLDQDLPQEMLLNSPLVTWQNRHLLEDKNYQQGKFQQSANKLFREQEFKDYLSQFQDDKIDFIITKLPYNELPKVSVSLVTVQNIEDPLFAKAINDNLAQFYQWQDAKGSSSVQGFKDYFFSSHLRDMEVEFRDKYPKTYTFPESVRELQEQVNPFLLYQLNIIP